MQRRTITIELPPVGDAVASEAMNAAADAAATVVGFIVSARVERSKKES